MKCQGEFIFKTLTHREGGVFKTEEGEERKYSPAYILKVDELCENGEINERRFKITEDKNNLINSLKSLEAYQKISLEFNVVIYTTKTELELINLVD